MLLAAIILLGFYFYQVNGNNLLPGFSGFGINKVSSLEEVSKSAATNCKIAFPELVDKKRLSIEEPSNPNKEKLQEFEKYISSLLEGVGIKVGPSPDYQIIDNLEYFGGTIITGSGGCGAAVYTKDGRNYFVYEKGDGSLVKVLVDKVK
jgi:hypothetical protein